MFSRMLCLKRRLNIYLKCIAIASLAIFYFAFLFRESLHAFEITKGGRNLIKEELKQKVITPQKRHLQNPPSNKNEQKQKLSKYILKSDEKQRFEVEEKRFIIDEEYDDNFINSKLSTSSTLNPVYEYSEELHSAIERDLFKRKLHLFNVCSKENLFGKYPPKSHEFFVSQGHNLVWCNVFKAASTTWMYYFNILGGYDIRYLQHTKKSPLELARIRFPRPKLNELNDALSTSLSFLTVREPFERLLSAYRDKLEGCRNKYYKTLSKQIIKLFRKNVQLKRHNSGPTFKEFLLFLIRNSIKHKNFDEHWTPIYSFCTPCSINYTLIAKIETFQRDNEYIIRQAGLEPLLLGKLPKKKIKTITNHSTHNTGSLIEKYFSQIDRNTLDELLKIYRFDFELFGYNYTKYYDIVQSPPPLPSQITTNIPSFSTVKLSLTTSNSTSNEN